jgi:hypothetical protein
MEHVLEAYHRPHGPALPLVSVDESSKQLVSEPRKPIPAALGRAARFDYEYQRNDQSVHDVRTGAGGESG